MAKTEFLKKGFEKASMKTIRENARVTTFPCRLEVFDGGTPGCLRDRYMRFGNSG